MFIFLFLFLFFGSQTNNYACKDSLDDKVAKNPYVFEVEIKEIYDSPGFSTTSFVLNHQRVSYKVIKTFKGKRDFDEIVVSHALYDTSPLVDNDKAQLSSTIFYKGNKLILFVEQADPENKSSRIKENEFVETNSECNVLISKKELLDNIEKILKN